MGLQEAHGPVISRSSKREGCNVLMLDAASLENRRADTVREDASDGGENAGITLHLDCLELHAAPDDIVLGGPLKVDLLRLGLFAPHSQLLQSVPSLS